MSVDLYMVLGIGPPALLCVVASYTDWKWMIIPNWVSAACVAWAALARYAGWIHPDQPFATVFQGFLSDMPTIWAEMAIGMACGLLLTLPGAAWGAMGGGDVKLVTALGASVGPIGIVAVYVLATLVGGLIAIQAYIRSVREFRFAPSIAVAYWMVAGLRCSQYGGG